MEPRRRLVRLGLVEGAVAIADRAEPRREQPARAGLEVVPDRPEGFPGFYATHHANIARALALTLGDPELGVEATDEAMTRAYQRWHQVSTYRNPQGWVYRVGLNWARSSLRRRRRTTSAAWLEEIPVDDPQPRDPRLARALAGLDPKHRSVVVLRYLLDWSVDQTADALQIAPGTVKSRLHRALSQLEERLAAEEKP